MDKPESLDMMRRRDEQLFDENNEGKNFEERRQSFNVYGEHAGTVRTGVRPIHEFEWCLVDSCDGRHDRYCEFKI